MGQPYICDKEEEVAAAAAAIPHTITSVNSGSKASRTGCYDDDDLPRTTTTAIQEAAASPKANKAKRRHMSQLFTKFLWHFRKPPDISRSTSEKKEEAADLASIQWHDATIPVPSLKITILVVGTRGDIQPFLAIGHKLKGMDHSVRLATHRDYEDLVKAAGLKFFPLGGDPKKLSSFMVETSGFRSIPEIFNERKLLTLSIKMLDEIIQSTWLACTAPYLDDPDQNPWIADAIISNPVCFGHLHCAEALSIPLHLFFPQPWTPTSEFPHPLSGLSYEKGWSIENWYSYHIMDWLMLEASKTFINNLRRSIGLVPVRSGERGYSYVFDNKLSMYLTTRFDYEKVPFAKIWSESLVPKPKDWGPHVDIIGNIFLDGMRNKLEPNFSPPPDLVDFLQNGRPPIFVGFGSMVMEDTSFLVRIITEAVKGSGERVVIQSNWSTFRDSTENFNDAIFFIGAESVRGTAERMAMVFSLENGVENGVKCFYKHLPLRQMVCDVSLYLKGDRTLIARRWCQDCELKLSILADEVIHRMPENTGHCRKEHRFMKWAIKGPVTPLDGAKEGILSFLHEVLASISDVVRLPVRGARKNNVVGAIKGLSIGIICLAQRPIREIEMVHGPTAWRYTFYGGFSDWELAVKDRLFGDPNAITQQNTGRARVAAAAVKKNEEDNGTHRDVTNEELMLAFCRTKNARKFFNALSCGKSTVQKAKVSAAISDLINDHRVKLNGGDGAMPDVMKYCSDKMESSGYDDDDDISTQYNDAPADFRWWQKKKTNHHLELRKAEDRRVWYKARA